MDNDNDIIILSDEDTKLAEVSSFEELVNEFLPSHDILIEYKEPNVSMKAVPKKTINKEVLVKETTHEASLIYSPEKSIKTMSEEVLIDEISNTTNEKFNNYLTMNNSKTMTKELLIEATQYGESFDHSPLNDHLQFSGDSPTQKSILPATQLGGKRKRRTREEIKREKLLKEVNRVRREINAAKNSKCEQYLFCCVNLNILAVDEQIKPELTMRFAERSISEQVIFCNEESMRVFWKRKHVNAYIEEGILHRSTSMNIEGVFLLILDADSFTLMVKEKNIMSFIDNELANYKMSNPQLTIVVLGKCTMRDSTLNEVIFEAFERFRVQIRFPKSALEFSFLVAQFHRAIAKSEKKSEYNSLELPVIAMQKGVREGPHLVRDWWSRMLDHVHRMTEDQKRALIDQYPCPIDLMDMMLAAENAGEAMYQLANVQVSRNKCLGPVIAQKLYVMLTSWDGSEVIHSC